MALLLLPGRRFRFCILYVSSLKKGLLVIAFVLDTDPIKSALATLALHVSRKGAATYVATLWDYVRPALRYIPPQDNREDE